MNTHCPWEVESSQGRCIPFQIVSRLRNFAPPPASPPALVGVPTDPLTCLMLYLSLKVKGPPPFFLSPFLLRYCPQPTVVMPLTLIGLPDCVGSLLHFNFKRYLVPSPSKPEFHAPIFVSVTARNLMFHLSHNHCITFFLSLESALV